MIKDLIKLKISPGVLALTTMLIAPPALSQDNETVLEYLPSVNELYSIASRMNINNGWASSIEIESKNYGSMSGAERAFEVGTTLSDVALVITSLDDGKSPSDETLAEASSAILALDNSPEMKGRLDRMKRLIESDKLDTQALQRELDSLTSEVFPRLRDNQDIKDEANLALAAATFKVMYLGAKSVAEIDEPTAQQLGLFRWSTITSYFVDYFTNKANAEFAKQPQTAELIASLNAIQPILAKARGEITKADIILIRDALAIVYS
ncbi:hypothetical protein QTP81_07580 [Alteromonas sp. ASW11-36]|uniref:Uncharacterized protein n=1 Tax=Alteromonas arenosi TaxID=3055817 RepID=A0ABT7SW87_9ALTE|nr:hypothetical protein [Alteromonas sp. ASW11-36]MDM7860453.1 hypothetical protein [Alteromonas sp. ASW11-36]